MSYIPTERDGLFSKAIFLLMHKCFKVAQIPEINILVPIEKS